MKTNKRTTVLIVILLIAVSLPIQGLAATDKDTEFASESPAAEEKLEDDGIVLEDETQEAGEPRTGTISPAYDPQPTSAEEVQAAQAILKQHWQYAVPAEQMPE